MQVLLLGGHGKVALYMTPLLLNRAWNVTSVVRNPDHESEILALGKGRKGKLNVLISSLEDVKSATDARKIIDSVTPDYVVWSAGRIPLTPLGAHRPPTVYRLQGSKPPGHTFTYETSPNKQNHNDQTNNIQALEAKVAPQAQSPSTKKPQSTS